MTRPRLKGRKTYFSFFLDGGDINCTITNYFTTLRSSFFSKGAQGQFKYRAIFPHSDKENGCRLRERKWTRSALNEKEMKTFIIERRQTCREGGRRNKSQLSGKSPRLICSVRVYLRRCISSIFLFFLEPWENSRVNINHIKRRRRRRSIRVHQNDKSTDIQS